MGVAKNAPNDYATYVKRMGFLKMAAQQRHQKSEKPEKPLKEEAWKKQELDAGRTISKKLAGGGTMTEKLGG